MTATVRALSAAVLASMVMTTMTTNAADAPHKSADEMVALMAQAQKDGRLEDGAQDEARGRASGEGGRGDRHRHRRRGPGDDQQARGRRRPGRPQPLPADGERAVPGRGRQVRGQVRGDGEAGGQGRLAGVPPARQRHARAAARRGHAALHVHGALGRGDGRARRGRDPAGSEGRARRLPRRARLLRLHVRGPRSPRRAPRCQGFPKTLPIIAFSDNRQGSRTYTAGSALRASRSGSFFTAHTSSRTSVSPLADVYSARTGRPAPFGSPGLHELHERARHLLGEAPRPRAAAGVRQHQVGVVEPEADVDAVEGADARRRRAAAASRTSARRPAPAASTWRRRAPRRSGGCC